MASLLLVDADRNFREALAIALRLDGLEVEAAASADEALERLARRGFDLCVVDAHLAGVEEVLETACARGARAVVTGPYPELLERAVRRHPRAEALAKPFPPAALASRALAGAGRARLGPR